MRLHIILTVVSKIFAVSIVLGQSSLLAPTLMDTSAINSRLRQFGVDVTKKSTQKNTYKIHGQAIYFPNAQRIGSNKLFDIYELPLDNMACLVPNKTYHDPTSANMKAFIRKNGLETNDKMPNLFKPQDLIIISK